jgi:hypothetical protein
MRIPLLKAKEVIKSLYRIGNRQPCLLLGAPGIGKTESIRQLASELAKENNKKFELLRFRYSGGKLHNYTIIYRKAIEILNNPENYFVLIEMSLSELDPVDLQGVPRDFEVNGSKYFDYNPFIWQIVASACPGIIFFDDITNVQRPDLRSILFKILRERMTGWIEFHRDMFIIAAGNSPEESAIASMLDSPIINRIRVFKVLPPSVDEWAEYMSQYDYDRRVLAFLKKFTQYFFQRPEEAETLDPFATPRQWTELAIVLHKFDDESVQESLIYSNVGLEPASHLLAFLRTQIPDADEIIQNPSILSTLSVDGKYLAISQIVTKISEDIKSNSVNKYSQLLNWLHDYDRELLMLLCVMLGTVNTRKLHLLCIADDSLNRVTEFFVEVVKLSAELSASPV